jgi:hypothetical protein
MRCRYVDCEESSKYMNCEYRDKHKDHYFCWRNAIYYAVKDEKIDWFLTIVEDPFIYGKLTAENMSWFTYYGFSVWNFAQQWFLEHTNIYHPINSIVTRSSYEVSKETEMMKHGFIRFPLSDGHYSLDLSHIREFYEFVNIVKYLLSLYLSRDVIELIGSYDCRMIQIQNANKKDNIDYVYDISRKYCIGVTLVN